ncbi:MAG: relaxase/mobilization nuclease domain-containing protein, partial [Aestuariivirga sp.]
MIAKKIANRALNGKAGAEFQARIEYVASKSHVVVLGNLAGTWGDAAFQMRTTARLRPRLRRPDVHLVISWATTENPTDNEMVASACAIVNGLGASGHQFVIALHNDRPAKHAHLVLNRVHPLSGKVLSLSNDFARLELACRQIERHFGWPRDRGRFDVDPSQECLRLMPKPKAEWERKQRMRDEGLRRQSNAVLGEERRSGLPALRDIMKSEVLKALRAVLIRSGSWKEVHQRFAAVGLTYEKFRSGGRIRILGKTRSMPACHLGRAFSLGAMTHRLGAYHPPARSETGLEAGELAGLEERISNPFFMPPRAAINSAIKECDDRRKLNENHRAVWKAVLAEQARADAHLRSVLGRSRTVAAKALRAVLRDDQAQERDALRRAKRAARSPSVADRIEALATAPYLNRNLRTAARTLLSLPPADYRNDHTTWRQFWLLDRQSLTAANDKTSPVPGTDLKEGPGNWTIAARRSSTGGIVGYDV